ncbi:hypothetical protein HDU82_005978 [Entophlyctis luteolus]|nr:hypothetical protein HDU82_005978 [Entophlyctis luteolus]
MSIAETIFVPYGASDALQNTVSSSQVSLQSPRSIRATSKHIFTKRQSASRSLDKDTNAAIITLRAFFMRSNGRVSACEDEAGLCSAPPQRGPKLKMLHNKTKTALSKKFNSEPQLTCTELPDVSTLRKWQSNFQVGETKRECASVASNQIPSPASAAFEISADTISADTKLIKPKSKKPVKKRIDDPTGEVNYAPIKKFPPNKEISVQSSRVPRLVKESKFSKISLNQQLDFLNQQNPPNSVSATKFLQRNLIFTHNFVWNESQKPDAILESTSDRFLKLLQTPDDTVQKTRLTRSAPVQSKATEKPFEDDTPSRVEQEKFSGVADGIAEHIAERKTFVVSRKQQSADCSTRKRKPPLPLASFQQGIDLPGDTSIDPVAFRCGSSRPKSAFLRLLETKFRDNIMSTSAGAHSETNVEVAKKVSIVQLNDSLSVQPSNVVPELHHPATGNTFGNLEQKPRRCTSSATKEKVPSKRVNSGLRPVKRSLPLKPVSIINTLSLSGLDESLFPLDSQLDTDPANAVDADEARQSQAAQSINQPAFGKLEDQSKSEEKNKRGSSAPSEPKAKRPLSNFARPEEAQSPWMHEEDIILQDYLDHLLFVNFENVDGYTVSPQEDVIPQLAPARKSISQKKVKHKRIRRKPLKEPHAPRTSKVAQRDESCSESDSEVASEPGSLDLKFSDKHKTCLEPLRMVVVAMALSAAAIILKRIVVIQRTVRRFLRNEKRHHFLDVVVHLQRIFRARRIFRQYQKFKANKKQNRVASFGLTQYLHLDALYVIPDTGEIRRPSSNAFANTVLAFQKYRKMQYRAQQRADGLVADFSDGYFSDTASDEELVDRDSLNPVRARIRKHAAQRIDRVALKSSVRVSVWQRFADIVQRLSRFVNRDLLSDENTESNLRLQLREGREDIAAMHFLARTRPVNPEHANAAFKHRESTAQSNDPDTFKMFESPDKMNEDKKRRSVADDLSRTTMHDSEKYLFKQRVSIKPSSSRSSTNNRQSMNFSGHPFGGGTGLNESELEKLQKREARIDRALAMLEEAPSVEAVLILISRFA